jgi:hypothetical protein
MNLDLPREEVAGLCQLHDVAISDIETLPGGGTHLVCRNSEGAAMIRGRLAKHLIAPKFPRFAFWCPKPPGWRAPESARLPVRS